MLVWSWASGKEQECLYGKSGIPSSIGKPVFLWLVWSLMLLPFVGEMWRTPTWPQTGTGVKSIPQDPPGHSLWIVPHQHSGLLKTGMFLSALLGNATSCLFSLDSLLCSPCSGLASSDIPLSYKNQALGCSWQGLKAPGWAGMWRSL